MADNVAVTAGSGTSIATDDVSSVHFQKIKVDAGGDGVSVPIIAGRQAAAASVPVVVSNEDKAIFGAVDETAPGTDTASSGLNGRLQRIAQRITSLIALLPAALGAGGGIKVDGSGTALPVSATDLDIRNLVNTDVVTAELSATDNAVLDAIAAVEGATNGAAVITDADGTIQQYLRGLVKLLITSGTIVLGAGTAAIGKLAANSGVDIGDVDVTSMPTGASAAQVQGTVAAGSAAAQNPVQMGGKAVSAIPAVVDANDVANLLTDLFGRHLVAAEAPNEAITEGNTATITDTTVTEVLAAAGASTKWRITTIGVYNSDATVGTWVKIQDDTAGTPVVYWRGYAAAAGGGFNINFSPPLPAKGQANGKINVVCETTSAEVGCSVNAFKVPG